MSNALLMNSPSTAKEPAFKNWVLTKNTSFIGEESQQNKTAGQLALEKDNREKDLVQANKQQKAKFHQLQHKSSSNANGVGGGGDGDGGAGAPPLTPPAPGAMAGMTYYATASAENTFSVNDELINARLSTAEGEIDSLQNQLTLEKRLNADIRSELQKMRDEEAR